MNKQASKRIRRKKFLISRRAQLVVAMWLMGTMVGMGLLYAIALRILPSDQLEAMNGQELQAFLTKTSAIYFGLATAMLGTLAIIMTHRIAGPVFVIHRAISGMREGDFSPRLSLRRKDHLKELAAEVSALRDEMKARDQKVHDLRACLDEGDLEGSREIFASMGVQTQDTPVGAPEAVVAEDAVVSS